MNRDEAIKTLITKVYDYKNKNVLSKKEIVKHEEFEAFCKAHGMSKVGATEQAIRQYMDKMNKALKNMK